MKTRAFAMILALALLLSLAACGEKTESKYPKNDFANLLTTDFWSMDEAALDRFLTKHKWRMTDDAEGRYLGTLLGAPAFLNSVFGEDGRLTTLTIEQQFQNEAARPPANDQAQLCEDHAAEFARFVHASRQVFAAHSADFDETKGVCILGNTEEELQTYFRSALELQLGNSALHYAWFQHTATSTEGAYVLPGGSIAELVMQISFRRDKHDAPVQQFSTHTLRLCAPDNSNPQPTDYESDIWVPYRDTDGNAAALPAWLQQTTDAELLLYGSEWTYRRVFPEEQLAQLLHALPQWVGKPIDAESAHGYDGAPLYKLYFYNGTTLLGKISFKPQEGWMAIYTTSDEYAQQEADAYYRFSTEVKKLDFMEIFELCTPRHAIPKPAGMQIISPEGQTADIPPAQAAALAKEINNALWNTSAVHLPDEEERLMDGGYWILRVTAEDGEVIEIWLDCFTSVSPKYPWSRFEDDLGSVAFLAGQAQMQALKELLQCYLE